MAKQQTFGDKLKKKKQADVGINVKVIKGMKGDAGTLRFVEKFVRVNDMADLDKMDFNK
jgi:hypothetical protein